MVALFTQYLLQLILIRPPMQFYSENIVRFFLTAYVPLMPISFYAWALHKAASTYATVFL
jgi:hypothetical protein